MPNIISKLVDTAKSAIELPIPPGFETLARIILPLSYKRNLSRLIQTAPVDFENNNEWWKKVAKYTTADENDIKRAINGIKSIVGQQREKLSDAIGKFSTLPQVRQDHELSELLEEFSKKSGKPETREEELEQMLVEIRERLEQVGDKINEKQNELQKIKNAKEGNSKFLSVTEDTEEVIIEGLFGDIVSKLTSFFSSPQLSNILSGTRKDNKNTKKMAKTAIYSLLQSVGDKAWEKLKQKGITRRQLIEAWKGKDAENSNKLILDKAAGILGSNRRFSKKARQKQDIRNKKRKSIKEDIDEIQEKPKKPSNPIEGIFRKMMTAAKWARNNDKDPYETAERVLQSFENKGVSEASIVRRIWDRHNSNNS